MMNPPPPPPPRKTAIKELIEQRRVEINLTADTRGFNRGMKEAQKAVAVIKTKNGFDKYGRCTATLLFNALNSSPEMLIQHSQDQSETDGNIYFQSSNKEGY